MPSSMRVRAGLSAPKSGCSASATACVVNASCTNSGATSRPATTLSRPMCGMLTSRLAISYVMRLVLYTTAHGQPATAASSVVVPLLQSATSAARSTSKDCARTIGNGTCDASSWIVGATLTTTSSPGRRCCNSRATASNACRCRSISCARLPGKSASTSRSAGRPRRRRASARSGSSCARSSSGCPTKVVSMPASCSSRSSNGRITAALVMTSAIIRSRPGFHAHTCGVM